ncbi:MAG: xanthine dehydrogenase family protein molybdopterin-binding subunit [Rhodospirillaceae bacterium]|nr:xanthine dehydrogenase family protein molybdopterin-binding subunit [Rhodospirillaceae bacterium]MDE0616818.1 xanthine dehydrogenase family protein molybdopterin-binding subunit [Rhodospirillaceae bacterium]
MTPLDTAATGVGSSLPRLDAREKVTGRATYIADMVWPGMLHAAIHASPHAHARILGYDTSAALAVPGVACVLTGDDFPDGRMGAFIKDEPAIAKGKVRYPGEPVAVVAAEDEETARRAAALIRVDYEDLPVAATPEEAVAPDAPLIHEGLADYFKVFPAICGGNVASETELSEGDVDAAWADCDVIVEGDFETPAQAHLSIEPVGALAEVDAEGRVTLWSANQSVFRVQANVCEALQLPMSKLRCLTPKVGAGFGNKMEPHVQPLVVQLALRTGRPVKLILNRTEDFETVRARHPFKIRCKTGAKKDGTLVARELTAVLDCGAYGDDSPGVLGYSLLMSRGPYRIPHCRASGKLVYTNRMRFGAFRGFGNPQVTFATESQIDEIAGRLGMDPLDLRMKNRMQPGDRWFGGGEVASNGLAECIEKAKAAAGWARGREPPAPPGKRRALGVAACAHISGLLATGAIVRLLEDGSVVLNTGAVDIGQGSDTVLTQMCASALKVPVDRVAIASPDTDGSPYNWGTTASRITYTTGRSVVAAADKVAEQIKRHASEIFECAVEDLELRDGGRVGIKGVPDKELSFFEVSGRAHWAAGGPIVGTDTWVYNQPSVDPKRAVARGLPFPQIGVYSFGCMIAAIEIDETTGKAEVAEVWSAMDVGKAINPGSVEGQIEGGFVQGMGFALTEEMVFDGPRLANPSMMDYKAPTSLDAPFDIHSIIVEAAEPGGPFGAKGIGEIGLVPVPAAIANAVAAAIGTRLRRLPLTPERVLDGMLEGGDED